MHTIYDVVDASVNHSCNSKRKTLRVKLTVTPEPGARRKDTTHAGNGASLTHTHTHKCSAVMADITKILYEMKLYLYLSDFTFHKND